LPTLSERTAPPYWLTSSLENWLSFRDNEFPAGTRVTCYGTMWSTPEKYAEGRAMARVLMRQMADGAYTSSTLDAIEDSEGEWTPEAPVVVVVEAPVRFDPETEMKEGGVLGLAVVWRERIALAVNRRARRKGLGTALLVQARVFAPGAGLYVAPRNIGAHHFLLEAGMRPLSVGSSGVVRYGVHEDEA